MELMDKDWERLVKEVEERLDVSQKEDWLAGRKLLLKRFRDLLTLKLKKRVAKDPKLATLLNDKTNYRNLSYEEVQQTMENIRVHSKYEFDLRTLQTSLGLSDQQRHIQTRTQNAFALFCDYDSYLDFLDKKRMPKPGKDTESADEQFKQQVFLNYQNRFVEIQKDWSVEVNSPEWNPSPKEQRAIERYWYLVFDEWHFCTQLNPQLRELWEQHYKKGVRGAFQNEHFKKRLEYLWHLDAMQQEFSEKFKEQLNDLCFMATGQRLKTE